MITRGEDPADCGRRPEYPLTPLITLTYQETGGETMTATAWAVGTDCSRCTHTWTVERWIVTAYPEIWDAGTRRLVEAVKAEMQQAGIWQPTLESFVEAGHRENAVHKGPAQAPTATTE